jgi:hypothetical protein
VLMESRTQNVFLMQSISEHTKTHLDFIAAQQELKAARTSGNRELIQKAAAVIMKAEKARAIAAIHFRR